MSILAVPKALAFGFPATNVTVGLDSAGVNVIVNFRQPDGTYQCLAILSRAEWAALSAFVPAAAPAPIEPAPVPPPTAPPVGAVKPALFAQDSWVNRKIPANPTIEAKSALWVQTSIANYTANAAISTNGYGMPVYFSAPDDPIQTPRIGNLGWSSYQPKAMRIPKWLTMEHIADGSDGHLVVIDMHGPNAPIELDVWQADLRNGVWGGNAIGQTNPTGDGVVRAGNGAIASNMAAAAGIITPDEIRAGVIEHCLTFPTPKPGSTYRWPATKGEHSNATPDGVPAGALVQLDPAVDITGLPRTQRIVAKCLQVYGMRQVDGSGAFHIRGRSYGRATDAWVPLGVYEPGTQHITLKSIPWSRCRVVAG